MTGPRNAAGCTPASCQTDPAEGWGCWAPGGNQISIRRPLAPTQMSYLSLGLWTRQV
jgi:hypothetical protein